MEVFIHRCCPSPIPAGSIPRVVVVLRGHIATLQVSEPLRRAGAGTAEPGLSPQVQVPRPGEAGGRLQATGAGVVALHKVPRQGGVPVAEPAATRGLRQAAGLVTVTRSRHTAATSGVGVGARGEEETVVGEPRGDLRVVVGEVATGRRGLAQ